MQVGQRKRISVSTVISPSAVAPSPQDLGEIFKLIGGYRISQAIYVVAETGIPDLLAAGPKSCDELAKETRTHAPTLYRLLRFLAGAGLFNEIGPQQFELTGLGAALRSDVPGSGTMAALLWLSESHWNPWSHLIHSVRTGETAFDHVHGMGVFKYLEKHPEESAVFNATMTASSARSGTGVVERYDFSGVQRVVDVGGGHGFLLAAILKSNPALRGVLFDLPDVVSGAGQNLRNAGVEDRCEIVGGSFFDPVPKGGDIYVLKQIIHDWDDDRALAILRNCRAAMTGTEKLLVIERGIAPNPRDAMRVLHIDLEMLVNVGGMERTDAQYRSLFERAGFRLTRILPLMDAAVFSAFEGVCA
jgi:O-methyltransferase domain/Dimerisation domain